MSPVNDSLIAKFGAELFELDPHTMSIPHRIIDCFSRVGMTPTEFALFIIISRFQFGEALPWPSIENLAGHLGRSTRTVERYIKRMQEKGFLRVERGKPNEQGNTPNRYDFKPFYDKIISLYVGVPIESAYPPQVKPTESEPGTNGHAPMPDPVPTPVPEEQPQQDPGSSADELPQAMAAYVTDLSGRFGDAEHCKKNISQARGLYLQLRPYVSDADLLGVFQDCASKAAAKQGIKTMNSLGQPNRMPYYFKLLRTRVEALLTEFRKLDPYREALKYQQDFDRADRYIRANLSRAEKDALNQMSEDERQKEIGRFMPGGDRYAEVQKYEGGG